MARATVTVIDRPRTVTTRDAALKVHSFIPRDRWNSLCVCGLSIAAHDAEQLTFAQNVDHLTRRFRRTLRKQLDTAPKERTWPSTASPFSRQQH